MDLSLVFDWGYDFYLRYPIFCYVAAGVLLLLLIWKPAKVMKTTLLVLVLVAILSVAFFLIDSMNFSRNIKEQAIHRTEKAIE